MGVSTLSQTAQKYPNDYSINSWELISRDQVSQKIYMKKESVSLARFHRKCFKPLQGFLAKKQFCRKSRKGFKDRSRISKDVDQVSHSNFQRSHHSRSNNKPDCVHAVSHSADLKPILQSLSINSYLLPNRFMKQGPSHSILRRHISQSEGFQDRDVTIVSGAAWPPNKMLPETSRATSTVNALIPVFMPQQQSLDG